MEGVSCFCLFSGGLDSMLAAKLMKDQGVEVICLHFKSFVNSKLLKETREKKAKLSAKEIAEGYLDSKYVEATFDRQHVRVLQNAKHGFGRFCNPCIDCKIAMLSDAKTLMAEYGVDFIIDGFVVNQRPMSQKKHIIEMMAKEAGVEDVLFHPLCPRHFPESLPVREGWVDMEKLPEITGRSRKLQLQLVQDYEIEDFQTPGGGCQLTDPVYGGKMRELLENLSYEEMTPDLCYLLGLGRHFRFKKHIRIICARNKEECEKIEGMPKYELGDGVSVRLVLLKSPFVGPSAIVISNKESLKEDIEASLIYCSGLILHFSKQKGKVHIPSVYRKHEINTGFVDVGELIAPVLLEDEVDSRWISKDGLNVRKRKHH